MTDVLATHDFDRWMADFGVCFPDFRAYVSRLPDAKLTRRSWYRSLRRVPYEVLGTVTTRMQDHVIAPLEPHQFGLFAHHVYAAARMILDERAKVRQREAQRRAYLPSHQQVDALAGAAAVDLLPRAVAAARVANERGFADSLPLCEAVVMLHDDPSERDRGRALAVIEQFGLSLADLEPSDADRRRPLLQRTPPETASDEWDEFCDTWE